jgi:hypothetical protein
LPPLENFLRVTSELYEACLAQVLAWHLGCYAVTAQRHVEAKDQVDHAKILSEANKLLRRNAKSGETGELLLSDGGDSEAATSYLQNVP